MVERCDGRPCMSSKAVHGGVNGDFKPFMLSFARVLPFRKRS